MWINYRPLNDSCARSCERTTIGFGLRLCVGEFGIWDQHELSLGRVYRVDTEQQDNNNKKMVHKVWVMDAVVLQDCGKMAVSTTGYTTRIYYNI